MIVIPEVPNLVTNDDTINDPLVIELYKQLKLSYYEKILDLSKIEMHHNGYDDLEFIHRFEIHIYKEDDNYRITTGRQGERHEINRNGNYYGDVFIEDENKTKEYPKSYWSVYEFMDFSKAYKNPDVDRVIDDFNQLFSNVNSERIVLKIIR